MDVKSEKKATFTLEAISQTSCHTSESTWDPAFSLQSKQQQITHQFNDLSVWGQELLQTKHMSTSVYIF